MSADSSSQDIKGAYRKLAAKWHPDKWASASEAEQEEADRTFRAIKEAYEILIDDCKRGQYDASIGVV